MFTGKDTICGQLFLGLKGFLAGVSINSDSVHINLSRTKTVRKQVTKMEKQMNANMKNKCEQDTT